MLKGFAPAKGLHRWQTLRQPPSSAWLLTAVENGATPPSQVRSRWMPVQRSARGARRATQGICAKPLRRFGGTLRGRLAEYKPTGGTGPAPDRTARSACLRGPSRFSSDGVGEPGEASAPVTSVSAFDDAACRGDRHATSSTVCNELIHNAARNGVSVAPPSRQTETVAAAHQRSTNGAE